MGLDKGAAGVWFKQRAYGATRRARDEGRIEPDRRDLTRRGKSVSDAPRRLLRLVAGLSLGPALRVGFASLIGVRLGMPGRLAAAHHEKVVEIIWETADAARTDHAVQPIIHGGIDGDRQVFCAGNSYTWVNTCDTATVRPVPLELHG